MEEKSSKGGWRKGAGRKPLKNPKKQVTLYIPKNNIYKFGSEEKMKEKIEDFIEKYGEETSGRYDAKETDRVKMDEVWHWNAGIGKPALSKIRRSFENYNQLKIDCENPEDWPILKEEILNADHLTPKQKSLLTT